MGKKKKKKKSFTIHIFPPLISSHEHRLISRSIGTLETQRSIRPCLVPSNYKLLLPLSLFCLIPHHQTSVRRKRSRIFFLFFGWEKSVFSFHNVTKRSPNSIEFCSSLFCEIFYSCLFSFPALQAIPKITLLDSEWNFFFFRINIEVRKLDSLVIAFVVFSFILFCF